MVRVIVLAIVMAVTTPLVGATPISFSDNFDRPDSASVGNGWSNAAGSVGANLSIVNGALAATSPFSFSGVYRPFDFSNGVRVQATLTHTDGFNGPQRYESQILLGSTGVVDSGLSLMIGRSDLGFNNSSVQLRLNGQQLDKVMTPFQYGTQVDIDFQYRPNGLLTGTVKSEGNVFNYSFNTPFAPLPGMNVGLDLEKSVSINPTFDNFSISGLVGIDPPVPVLPGTPVPQPQVGNGVFLGNPFGNDGKLLDPTKPLIVITHGWQPKDPVPPAHTPPQWVNDMGFSIRSATNRGVNVLTWEWDDAFTKSLGRATAAVEDQGLQLGQQLEAWGVTANTTIHFIGHSLGTLVNANATAYLASRGIPTEQFTILDRPFGQDTGSFISTDIDAGKNADEIIFQRLLAKDSVRFVDNYYGNGDPDGVNATGAAFQRATAFNQLYAGQGHSGVHDTYLATISILDQDCPVEGGFACSPSMGGNDGRWKVWNPGNLDVITQGLDLGTVDWLNLRCSISGGITTCREGSPAYYWNTAVSIPDWARYLSFDFKWANTGDGDWLSLLYGDKLLFNFLGTTYVGDGFVSSGLLPIQMFAGHTDQLLFMLNSVGSANAEFSITNVRFTGFAPEPTTALLWISGMLAFLVAGRNTANSSPSRSRGNRRME